MHTNNSRHIVHTQWMVKLLKLKFYTVCVCSSFPSLLTEFSDDMLYMYFRFRMPAK